MMQIFTYGLRFKNAIMINDNSLSSYNVYNTRQNQSDLNFDIISH